VKHLPLFGNINDRRIDQTHLSFMFKDGKISVLIPNQISFEDMSFDSSSPDHRLNINARVREYSYESFMKVFTDNPAARPLIELLKFRYPELLI
jgi:hypothetical protein